jgi:hypothetical protein
MIQRERVREQSFLDGTCPTRTQYFSTRNKKGGENLMVVTSRGGVGCCWVKSLVRLVDYESTLFGADSVLNLSGRRPRLNQLHKHEIS